eukprot:scaffold190942_cov14-Tisochrysis_lutea.AAC.1
MRSVDDPDGVYLEQGGQEGLGGKVDLRALASALTQGELPGSLSFDIGIFILNSFPVTHRPTFIFPGLNFKVIQRTTLHLGTRVLRKMTALHSCSH